MRLLNKAIIIKKVSIEDKNSIFAMFCFNFIIVVKGPNSYKCPKRKI